MYNIDLLAFTNPRFSSNYEKPKNKKGKLSLFQVISSHTHCWSNRSVELIGKTGIIGSHMPLY